jgi:hypothetical protein
LPRRDASRVAGHAEDNEMGKYLIAWLLGVPIGVLVLIYLIMHVF